MHNNQWLKQQLLEGIKIFIPDFCSQCAPCRYSPDKIGVSAREDFWKKLRDDPFQAQLIADKIHFSGSVPLISNILAGCQLGSLCPSTSSLSSTNTSSSGPLTVSISLASSSAVHQRDSIYNRLTIGLHLPDHVPLHT